MVFIAKMLDQPVLSVVLQYKVPVVDDLTHPAFQQIPDADSGCL
jgi:hypothetical protein